MIHEYIRTAEFVTPKHPDKICDRIADSVLDEYLSRDPNAHTAIEIMGGHGQIAINGEVKSSSGKDIPVKDVIERIVGEDYEIFFNIENQSLEIARGVDIGGAGDQGIMIGYACDETESMMPKEYELARTLCRQLYDIYPFDGKVQVTLKGDKVSNVVASFQNTKTDELKSKVELFLPAENYHINPAGEWQQGGFDADTGLSGRKIIIDAYGPNVSVGGGSFSGKDATKVDRSGAYMARKIAVDLLKEKGAHEVIVKLAYAIGETKPIMAIAQIDGKEESIVNYDLSPRSIQKLLFTSGFKYEKTADWGHFGRDFVWDRGI